MKVEKINAKDFFDDDNNGLIYGLQEIADFPAYVEWFASEEEREKCIKKNKMKVINVENDRTFEAICRIETTLKCNYVDEYESISKVLKYAKENQPELFKHLIELYKEYYGKDNKFWEDI